VKDILKKEHGVVKNGADSQKIKEISQNHVYFLLAMFKMKQTFTKSLHNEKNGLKSPQLEKDIHKSDIFDCNSIKLELCFTLKKWKCWTRISIYYYRFLSWVKFICSVFQGSKPQILFFYPTRTNLYEMLSGQFLFS